MDYREILTFKTYTAYFVSIFVTKVMNPKEEHLGLVYKASKSGLILPPLVVLDYKTKWHIFCGSSISETAIAIVKGTISTTFPKKTRFNRLPKEAKEAYKNIPIPVISIPEHRLDQIDLDLVREIYEAKTNENIGTTNKGN